MKILIIAENRTFKVGEIVDISKERAESAIARGLAKRVTIKKEVKNEDKI